MWDGPILPSGWASFRASPPADTGFEAYVYKANLSFLPESYVGTGITTPVPPGLKAGGVLAINKTVDSGLPGILIPSFRTQPLSPAYPTG